MNRILELRNALNMTQEEFADYCGIARSSIARYEASGNVSRANAEKIAQACGVSVSYVIADTNEIITRPTSEPAHPPLWLKQDNSEPPTFAAPQPKTEPRPTSVLTDNDLAKIADLIQQPNAEAPRTLEARIVSFGMDKLPKEDRERLLAMIRALYSNRPELFNNDKKGDTDDARY